MLGDYDPDQENIKEPIKITIVDDTDDNKHKIKEVTWQYPKWMTKRSGKVIPHIPHFGLSHKK